MATSDTGDEERLPPKERLAISKVLDAGCRTSMIKRPVVIVPANYSTVISEHFIRALQTKYASGHYGYEYLMEVIKEKLDSMKKSKQIHKPYYTVRIRYAVELYYYASFNYRLLKIAIDS